MKSISLLSLLYLSVLLPGVSSVQAEKMNVVLIMGDDVGYECFSTYGSKEYHTPRLDALAAKGIRFDNCHSTPLCTPSRVNLMSGKSNVFNYVDFGVYPKGVPTFANYFKSQGYVTAVAGKWQLKTDKAGITPTEAGFDSYCLWNYPGGGKSRYWNPSFIKDGELLEPGEQAYGPDIAAGFLIDFMKANKDKPFLAYYPMILPHSPFPPTPDSKDRNSKNSKQNYIDMVQYIDKLIGQMEDALIEMGIREKTLLVFTGDNGTNESITSTFDGKPLRGAKGYTKDHGTHVPLIVSLPGKIPAGQSNRDLICFSDFLPTIVEAAGLPARQVEDGDGWSFWPQCLGQAGKKREWIYGYYFPRPYSARFDKKYSHYEVRYARDKRYKLYDNGELYDTAKDVLELKPLPTSLEQLTEVRRKLQAALDKYPSKGNGIDYSRVKGKFEPKAKRKKRGKKKGR